MAVTNNRVIISNGTIVFPDTVKATDILIENGIIKNIGKQADIQPTDQMMDATGKYILPGFIDIHTNGAAGFDLSSGSFDPGTKNFKMDQDAFQEGLQNALAFFFRHGSTNVMLTSIAAPVDQLEKAFEYTSDYKNRKMAHHDVLHGISVEGTFIKLPAFRGAQNPQYFHEPSVSLFDSLQKAAGGLIKIVNVPPEHEKPGLELIEYLAQNGVIAAAGHTGASAEQFYKAAEKGLNLAIHLHNGPILSSPKPFGGGGALEAILKLDECFIELITDGYHVSVPYVLDTIRRKGIGRTCIVTDSLYMAGLQHVTFFELSGIKGRVSENGFYLHTLENPHTLFGSVLTMDKAFENMLNWLTVPTQGIWHKMHEPLDFNDALLNTSVMCSAAPARVLGIYDLQSAEKRFATPTGSIEPGKKANIIIADIRHDENGYHLQCDKVFSG